MEYGLADKPQEAVDTSPEYRYLGQCLSAAVKQGNLPDDIAESQNQTAYNDGRNQGSKYLCQTAHDSLDKGLVLHGSLLHRLLGDSLYACHLRKIIVKGAHLIANYDLELPCLGECTLGRGQAFDGLCIRFGRIV